MICSRTEFEKLCGISKAHYSMYRSRGKIIERFNEDGTVYIDTSIPENNEMLVKGANKKQQAVDAPQQNNAPVAKSVASKTTKNKPTALAKRANEEIKSNTSPKYDLEVKKLEVEIKQKEVATALNEQKLATIMGNNIPAPIVTEAFAQLAKSLLTGYKGFFDQQIQVFCHKHKISDKNRIEFVSKIVTGLNAAHTKSVNDAKANMKAELRKYKIKDSMEDEPNDN